MELPELETNTTNKDVTGGRFKIVEKMKVTVVGKEEKSSIYVEKADGATLERPNIGAGGRVGVEVSPGDIVYMIHVTATTTQLEQ